MTRAVWPRPGEVQSGSGLDAAFFGADRPAAGSPKGDPLGRWAMAESFPRVHGDEWSWLMMVDGAS